MKKSKRRNYGAEFKRNVVKLASEPGRTNWMTPIEKEKTFYQIEKVA